ncbi:Chaperone protein dnaJ 49 [Morella rubra]|uniref:Chaperone protein dnaJ 49 n=1 Tax=Morella rubra TaxID=262757 RepID=A0A6A1VB88_9ROSI|nr:Chaperone protein dnaJ 49 [Morella rubra]
MEGNKDDALKCLKIGKEALEGGDRTRAFKFITKASRLDPTLPVDDLLSALEKDSNGAADQKAQDSNGHSNGQADPPPPTPSKQSDQPSLRHRVPSAGPASSSASSSASYTEEQIAIVRQIKKKRDYYEILGLERSCTVEDVRKAYRKLSLKVHPDKNKAPGADEAFKVVSKAFQCLSNEETRRKYEVSGSDEPVYERRAARRGAPQGYNGYYEAEFDAEEIFRNFFFGGMAPATTQFRGFNFGTGTAPRGGDNGSTGGLNARMLIQLLPVLLILLLSFFPSSEPIYALSRSYPYEYRFTTLKGVNYYVKSTKFEQDYPSGSAERAALEGRVEREYFNILSQNCRLEIQRRQWGFIRETPHCDMLQRFESVA